MFATSQIIASNQMELLRNKSLREHNFITQALANDIVTFVKTEQDGYEERFSQLINRYTTFYIYQGVILHVVQEPFADGKELNTQLSIVHLGDKRESKAIHVNSSIKINDEIFTIHTIFDISSETRVIHRTQYLLNIVAITSSILACIIIFLLIRKTFKPFTIISKTAKKIAEGNFSERIDVKEAYEYASIANDFNHMAETIENNLSQLSKEAGNKQRFIDSFSHEIRTPLTSIYGYAQYIQQTKLRENELLAVTQYIIDNASYVTSIANSLLDLAVLENQVIQKSPVDILNLIALIMNDLNNMINEKNIDVNLDIEEKYVDAQEDLLRILLLNLIKNAIQSIELKEGIIQIRCYKKDNKIILEVEDNGCGISQEDIEHIVEPFYRVNSNKGDGTKSIGLGLSLCKQIVSLHDAIITFNSVVSEGSVVRITFYQQIDRY